MSNPYLTIGSNIPNYSGPEDNVRTFVTNISFDDDDIQFLNAEDLNYKDTNGRNTIFIASMRQTDSGNTDAKNHVPPFIDKGTWTKNNIGIMYNSSMTLLNNGSLIPAALVPNKEEFTNNQMEWDLDHSGAAGADKKNTVWTWKAREISKNEDEIVYGDYFDKKYFDSMWADDNNEQLRATTEVLKGGAQIRVPTNYDVSVDKGISLELDATKLNVDNTLPWKEYGFENKTDAGNSSSKFFNSNGTYKGARLGSFMLVLDLEPDEKRQGEDLTKRPPWEVNIRMHASLDIKDGDPGNNKITINISKGNLVKVNVYGRYTQFNLPAPPSATNTQASGEQSPNAIAITVVPVFNGLMVSVGNFNGLDKEVSNRMSKFCESNPALSAMSLYKDSYDVDYDPDTSSFPDDNSPFIESGEKSGPNILVQSINNKDNPGKNGLIPVGDLLGVDIFNAVGKVAYIPLFFQTHTDAIIAQPIVSDLELINITNVDFVYWPIWFKNGIGDAALVQKDKKGKVETYTFKKEDKEIRAPVDYYDRTPSGGDGLATAVLIGNNPFVAGDNIVTEEIPGGGNGSTWEVTESFGNTVKWIETGNDSAISSSGGTIYLDEDRTGSLITFTFSIRCGYRKDYSANEDSTEIATRYNAIAARYNESYYARFPIVVFGCIRVQRDDLDLSVIKNDNTPYLWNIDPEWNDEWINCITNISVTHALEGTSGQMTMDRFAFNQIYGNDSDFAFQRIGQVPFDIELGKSGIDTDGSKTYAIRLGRDNDSATSGTLLKGFAYGFGIDQSVNGATLTIPLFGINKKLQEMKLYNAPFFDGKTVEETIDFFCNWGNVDRSYAYTNKLEKLSGSSVLGQVRHEFKMGTPLWDAMQEVGDDTANYVVVQPNGKIYLYKINQYGEPEHENFTPKNWEYPNVRVLNLARNPDFSQFYNKIIVMALQNNASALSGEKNENPANAASLADDLPLFPIAVGADLTNATIPLIPWEKLVVKPLTSFWSKESLSKYARVLAKQAISIYYTGTTTIPGNLGVRLWDKLNDRYWITGITHNYDSTSRRLTTDLTVAVLRPTGEIQFLGDDNVATVDPPTNPIEPYVP